ncbi:MAG: 3-phosphoglycerate dehydrogenase, partial [Ignavibacteria bacterium]|nr:3-phosphoglycerate dehydrogenase [Ignavibacteria bacterium]
LIADKFPQIYIDQIKALGQEVVYSPKLRENDLPNVVKDIECIVVRSTVVNATTIKEANNLKLIIRAGSGVNNIDINAANEKNVYVTNCPGKNAIAVAELAMGLIISLDRKIPDNVIDFRNGVWNKDKYSKAEGLFGKTLGIVGVGNIGKELAIRAKAFGINVLGYDIVKYENVPLQYVDKLEDLLTQSDIISIHLPASPKTKKLFDKNLLNLLKPKALLVNTSRSDVIDEDALLEVIKEKNIYVAVDVFKGEPEQKEGSVSSALQSSPNVYVTHHIGASTEQAQNAVAEETVRIIKEFVETGNVLNCVNLKK